MTALLFLACVGSDDAPAADSTEPAADSSPANEDSEAEETCGPEELCTRSIDECGINMTLEACTSWYANESNCLDMAAYTTCNCDCIGEETCDDYFSCGEICFAAHCE